MQKGPALEQGLWEGYFQWPRQESNLNLELRKLLYYPLYYEAWLRSRESGVRSREPTQDAIFPHLINPGALVANIFTAMASNITPKNFLTAIKPAGPSNFAMTVNDFNTAYTMIKLTRIAISSAVSP